MLNAITENAEGAAALRIHRAPINSAYLRQLNDSEPEIHRLPRKPKIDKDEAPPPYFKDSALNDLFKNPVPQVLCEREPLVKRESLLHLSAKGYPSVDNSLRKEWEGKFERILPYFENSDKFIKAVNSVRKHSHTSVEDAFCALAHCDGVVLETIRRLTEGPRLRKEIAAVRFVYNIEEMLQQILVFLKGESSSTAQLSHASDQGSKRRRAHRVELTGHKEFTGINDSLQNSTISEQSLNSILSSTSRPKFERFHEEMDRRVQQSRSMEIMSRREVLLANRDEIRERYKGRR